MQYLSMKCCEAQIKQAVQVPFLVFRELSFYFLSHASKAAGLGTVFRAVSSALSQKAAYNIYQPHILHHHHPPSPKTRVTPMTLQLRSRET